MENTENTENTENKIFENIQKEFDNEYNIQPERYINKYREISKYLNELKELYEKYGEDKLVRLFSSSILTDRYLCSPGDILISLGDNYLKQYYMMLGEFNRQYLSHIFKEIPLEIILKFITTSMSKNNISKEFIESVKLHPENKDYIESQREGNWD